MAGVADRLAAGDLRAEIEPRSDGDRFGRAFKQMILSMRASIGQIDQGAQHVASASSQITTASGQSRRAAQTLSASSNEINSTIHEIAASVRQVSLNAQTQTAAATENSAAVTQMAASLHSTAENVKHLAALAAAASAAAQAGQHTFTAASVSMQRISTSVESAGQTIHALGDRAENISKIVETIDDIADQTNLLALNAAIEAARAGEHGLGFAVVADEVRKLAERSARSTKEISEIVAAIQRESRAAVAQMVESNKIVRNHAADSSISDRLETIRSTVESIVARTREIEAATAEQSIGADQIAQATQSLSRLTQEISAAAAEQSTASTEVTRSMGKLHEIVQQAAETATDLQGAAESLHHQSIMLKRVVGKFETAEVYDMVSESSEISFTGGFNARSLSTLIPDLMPDIRPHSAGRRH
jgi:methyl-accepting chemotaxis protein